MSTSGTASRAVQGDRLQIVALGVTPPAKRERIIDATLRCLARQGTAKTTVDDIAREASVSRATVYRTFPGGREDLLASVVDTEVARLYTAIGLRLGEADELTDALVDGIVEASARIVGHPALRYLVRHEPETILGHLAFEESNRLLDAAAQFAAPFLARWMSSAEAARVAEWATRIVLSYAIAPSPSIDLTDPVLTRRLVEQFVLPGIDALHAADLGSAIDITPYSGHPATDRSDTTNASTANASRTIE